MSVPPERTEEAVYLESAALYGRDPTPRIVDVRLHEASADADQALVRVYERNEAFTEVTEHTEPFYPFFFLSDLEYLRGSPRQRYRVSSLQGDGAYRYLVVFDALQDYWDALRRIERSTGGRGRRSEAVYVVNSPPRQYLIQTGRTLFKGMAFEHLHRLQLDIEVYSESGFPNAERPDDAVILIALSDNREWVRVLNGQEMSEAEMLAELVRLIRERDPDVIEGHNIYAFDLPYLMTRFARHGISPAFGRDGSAPRSFPSSIRFAERSVDFPAFEIQGRHVIDTYFLVMAFDVVKRNLPGYSLKAAARYFGFAPKGRTYVEGDEIARVWRQDPERLIAYARDDVIETERLARRLSRSTFYLTQMAPMPYGQLARTGPAAKIESLFIREYLRRRHSIPRSQWGSQVYGGYTDVFITGVVGPVVYADVESLYPSIMLQYDVKPASDTLNLFPDLLRRLTDLRIRTKHQMQQAPSAEEMGELDARQSSFKILINAFYGSLGFTLAAFNDFAEADRVASIGQELVRQIIGFIQEAGGRVVEVDTDGVLFVPPPDCTSEETERALVRRISKQMPPGIRVGYDGRYRKMLSYKKKNYALLTYDGKLVFKGSSLVSRSSERFGRQFVREAIRLLLNEDIRGLHDLYITTRDLIMNHGWDSADAFSKTETLKNSVDEYLADVAAGKRTRAASYELAMSHSVETGRPVRKGDRIAYYVTGAAPNVVTFENCRLADEWNPSRPDENTSYYLRRLDEFAAKFQSFFSDSHFRLIFSPEDLFGFSPEGITLVTWESRPDSEADPVPF